VRGVAGTNATHRAQENSIFALTSIGAFALVAHQSFDTSEVIENKWAYFWIAGLYGYLIVPYFFAGLTIEQTAAALELSTGTIEREWRFIRAWLQEELAS